MAFFAGAASDSETANSVAINKLVIAPRRTDPPKARHFIFVPLLFRPQIRFVIHRCQLPAIALRYCSSVYGTVRRFAVTGVVTVTTAALYQQMVP